MQLLSSQRGSDLSSGTACAGTSLWDWPILLTISAFFLFTTFNAAYAADVNVALNKLATQSSTFGGAGPSRAVDGNTNNSWSGGSISHTNAESGVKSWWQVDLGSVQDISSVKLFNRTGDSNNAKNRLKNYYVFVADTPFPSGDPDPSQITNHNWSTFETAVAGHPTTFNLNNMTGRYVRVQLDTANVVLNMAEVEVWGPDTGQPQTFFPATSPTPRTDWYEDLDYGMFVHFNMPTFYGGGNGATNWEIHQGLRQEEGTTGPATADKWDPTTNNAQTYTDDWVQLAVDGGMEYIIMTAHHNQGFLMWDSAHSTYDVASASNTDDVVDAFVTSARNANMPFGFYFNSGIDIWNWGWAGSRTMTDAEYEAYFEDIVGELLTAYPDIDFLWFDQPQAHPNASNLYDHIKSINPDVIVIHNSGLGTNSIATSKYDAADWETIHFGDNRLINGTRNYSPTTTIGGVQYHIPKGGIGSMLTDWFWWGANVSRTNTELENHYTEIVVNQGANLVANVAPDKTGKIPSAQANAVRLAGVNLFGNPPPPPNGVNVALNKPATQSSSPFGVATADKAVDGNTSGTYLPGNSSNPVSITGANSTAWWEVNLQSVENNISTIEIWNREGGAASNTSNFYVFVSDSPFTSTNLSTTLSQSGVSNYLTSGTAGRPTTISINRSGRYVRVQLNGGTATMGLAEVKVFD